ncbi:DUF4956 domain-containing protein [Actinoplanes teichomyceticus]|uniref:Uncharacterized protein DUF4956 n=1 Tax=Actinoplanes teichomyceticus TaxID=1867 RepID=A0A561WKK9_ACTTI|nr:DUF4956 domain-containing protein [Actinoplanes teichomyceticus]TWG24398.1 uncharacterized protein DUF4956 [Actinoplanes teichomyceticus]GIF12751.1 hypothetical protein Ate01nite_27830 [Actinoplanes teichomyceticus]
MHRIAVFGMDLLAVGLLVFGLYFPRHRRRNLIVAYLGVNVGVLAVAGSLSSSAVGAGLGPGLLGVLSPRSPRAPGPAPVRDRAGGPGPSGPPAPGW